MNVFGAGGHVQFHVCDTCAILSTVSLLLHEQMHSVQAEEMRTIPGAQRTEDGEQKLKNALITCQTKCRSCSNLEQI